MRSPLTINPALTALSWAFFLAFLAFSQAWADNPFSGATVVVLCGLPGDLDSATAYNLESQQLLTDLNRPQVRPKKLFFLSSLTDFDPGKLDYPVEQQSNKRDSFLNLADTLKTTGPVVFVVFGHGGVQGTDPVFHVPGPRITPTDMLGLAASTEKSTWFLFFRGSAFFSKAVLAPGRTIYATEDDQTFLEDPLSFTLFLDAFKEYTDLPALTESWASKTYHWFQDRGQARTEEPSLWLPGADPQKLITPDIEKGIPFVTNNAIPTPPVGALGVALADPKKYPDSDAAILSWKEGFVLGTDQELAEDEDQYIQIFKPEGKRWGDFNLSFTPPDEDLQFVDCEIQSPSGEVETIGPDDIHDAMAGGQEGETKTQNKIFSFPKIEVGSVIHVHYIRSFRTFPLPHVCEEIPLTTEIPVLSLLVEIRYPKNTALSDKVFNVPGATPEIKAIDYGTVHRWTFHDLPPAKMEELSPPESEPRLSFTTFPNWADFVSWYVGAIRDVNTATPEMVQTAKDLVKDAKTDRDKIAAVTQFVTQFRYVAVPIGINAFRPHDAADVFKNHYGDCKDKANLLCSLLNSLGYKTNLVLVPRMTQAYPELPGLAFNHCIAVVHLDNQDLWIDSTDDICTFGLLPPGDPGRNVLVVKDDTDGLTELPKPKMKDNRFEITTKVKVDDGRVLTGDISVTTTGFADYLLRRAKREVESQPVGLPLLAGYFASVNGRMAATDQTSSAIEELNSSFNWHAKGSWNGLIAQIPSSKTRLLMLPTWLPREWGLAAVPRKNDLYLNNDYPMTLVENWTITLPANSGPIALPQDQSHNDPSLSWQLSWTKGTNTDVQAHLEVNLPKTSLHGQEVTDFQASFNLLGDALRDGLSYSN